MLLWILICVYVYTKLCMCAHLWECIVTVRKAQTKARLLVGLMVAAAATTDFSTFTNTVLHAYPDDKIYIYTYLAINIKDSDSLCIYLQKSTWNLFYYLDVFECVHIILFNGGCDLNLFIR